MGFIAERRVPTGMMSARENRRFLKVSIAFIVGLVAIGIIVANIRYLDLGQGSSGPGPEFTTIIMALIYALAIIGVALLVLILLRYKVGARGKGSRSPFDGNQIIGLVIVLLLIVILAAIQGQSTLINQNQDPPIPDSGTGPADNGNNPVANDATGGMSGLFILVAGLAVALAIVAFRHERPAPWSSSNVQLTSAQQNAADTIRQATLDLFAGEDPRSVIVRTYQQMSRLLGKQGRSLRSLTPREVAELAKQDLGWPESPLTELTSLFEEAWYSEHAMGEAERDRALRAFEAIAAKEGDGRVDLGRSAS